MSSVPVFSVSDFVAVFNQTIEYSYPLVRVVGEISSFKIAKGRWVYFDLKDELSKIRCFGAVQQLPGPMEDGMLVEITATPALHPQFGFTLNLLAIELSGEGTIHKAYKMLEATLQSEGLFDRARKRTIPFPPKSIGLVTANNSAAYADFMKIIKARWLGIEIQCIDVHVQGANAVSEIIGALEYFNKSLDVDVVVITRGGGNSDDLQAFNHETMVRAIAASRIPTLVAVGHEIDICLAERVADLRASTPSNAAELLVPDKKAELARIIARADQLHGSVQQIITRHSEFVTAQQAGLSNALSRTVAIVKKSIQQQQKLLDSYDPRAVLNRGYALLQKEGKYISSGLSLEIGDSVDIYLRKQNWRATITERLKGNSNV